MARMTVSQLRANMTLKKHQFLLRDKSVSTMRTGNAMLRVTLADRTGSILGVYFDVPSTVPDSLVVGQGVEVSGRVGEFRDQLQINIERIVPAQLTDPAEFLPAARRATHQMLAEFDALRASIKNPDLARLLAAIFGDQEFYQAFTQAPGAKFNHHACVGGLLEHTLSVARLVQTACELYPELDRDLAITVALLHDLGKVRAYQPLSFDLTEEGSLWTHLYMGASQVEHTINTLQGFDPELRLRVVHAILAHHGTLENGSPVMPMTLEAIVLHYADNLDGDARGASDHLERTDVDKGAFTEMSSMHGTRLYRGSQAATSSPKKRQETLW